MLLAGLQASPSMKEQLHHEVWQARASMPDIVAVGFQEVVPLNASNVMLGEFKCMRIPTL